MKHCEICRKLGGEMVMLHNDCYQKLLTQSDEVLRKNEELVQDVIYWQRKARLNELQDELNGEKEN